MLPLYVQYPMLCRLALVSKAAEIAPITMTPNTSPDRRFKISAATKGAATEAVMRVLINSLAAACFRPLIYLSLSGVIFTSVLFIQKNLSKLWRFLSDLQPIRLLQRPISHLHNDRHAPFLLHRRVLSRESLRPHRRCRQLQIPDDIKSAHFQLL